MAFKRKTDTSGGEQFKFENAGDSLTGYYLGSPDFEGEYGPTKKHLFKTKKGIRVVFGQTHLTQLLEGEKPGCLMQVTYTEDKKMKKGNPMKCYTVDIDDEQKLDASEIPTTDDAEEPNYEAAGDDEPAEEAEEETPMDEVKVAPPAKKAAPAAPAKSAPKKSITEILAERRKTA